MPHVKTDQEHQDEVQNEWNGNAHNIQRNLHDELAFQAEHDHNRKEQGDQCQRVDFWNESLVIPLPTPGAHQQQARQETGNHRDAQVDKHALSNFTNADLHQTALQTKQGWQFGDKDPGVNTVKQYLENAVEGYNPGGVFRVASGQFVPHDDHGDTARQTDHDQPYHILGIAAQENYCQ